MKHYYLIALFLCWIPVVFAQNSEQPVMIWVAFTDKNHNTYQINQPQDFLSERALLRRSRQNIRIDSLDLPVSYHYIEQINLHTQAVFFYSSRWLNGALLKITDLKDITTLQSFAFIKSLEELKPGAALERNYGLSGTQAEEKDPEKNLSASSFIFDHEDYAISLQANYGESSKQLNMLNATALHQQGFWGAGQLIAVLDAGFRNVDSLAAFAHLWNDNRILAYRDFVLPGNDIFRTHHHGTLVLSVMAAWISGSYTGSAPLASYLLLRTEDAASEFRIEEYNWLRAAEFADSAGANIINSSLGYTVFDNPRQNYTYSQLDGKTTIVAQAANIAASRGMLVVNSAGNYGSQNWRYLGSPADAPGVLAVGAVDVQGKIAPFSSLGPTADGRTKPDVMAMGSGVSAINPWNEITRVNGTSFSAPLISGLAACLWQKSPDFSTSQIKRAIRESGHRFFNADSLYGYGIADFQKAAGLLENHFVHPQFSRIYPNPFNEHSKLSVYSREDSLLSLEVFNISGQRVLLRENILLHKGYNTLMPFDQLVDIRQGVYLIRIHMNGQSELLRTVKAW